MAKLFSDWRRLAHIALIFAGALAVGAVLNWLRMPLPWMIGAMLFSASVRLSDRPVNIPGYTRPIGQMLVASSVGLAFTAEALAAMGAMLVPMVASAIVTVLLSLVVAAVLVRLSRVDAVTASLASVPMGPVESANLALRHGIEPGPVVFSQTLRIVLLVTLIPPVLVALNGGIDDPSEALRNVRWTPSGALILAALALAGALVAKLVRLSNPFFIGAIAGAAVGSALGLPLSAYPYPVLVMAQTLLGVFLGSVFSRALFRDAGNLVGGALVAALLLTFLCVLMALVLAALTGESWAVMVLATAPGSVTEMSLTAKILQEGLAMVTAFHLVRIFVIMPFAPLIIGAVARIATHMGQGPDDGK